MCKKRWIPVNEKLPDDSSAVLMALGHGAVLEGFYAESKKKWVRSGIEGLAVTHWMPFPEPPKDIPVTYDIFLPEDDMFLPEK